MAARLLRPFYRREAGNPAVEMIDSLHRSIANPTSSSCQQHLRIDCTIGDLPPFLTDSFYAINNISLIGEFHEYLIQADLLEPEEHPVDGVLLVPDEIQYRRLLNLIPLSKGSRGSSLMIAAAIIGLCDANVKPDISAIAAQLSMNVETCTLDEFVEIMGIQTNKHNDIDNLKSLNVAHYVLAASMLVNLTTLSGSSVGSDPTLLHSCFMGMTQMPSGWCRPCNLLLIFIQR